MTKVQRGTASDEAVPRSCHTLVAPLTTSAHKADGQTKPRQNCIFIPGKTRLRTPARASLVKAGFIARRKFGLPAARVTRVLVAWRAALHPRERIVIAFAAMAVRIAPAWVVPAHCSAQPQLPRDLVFQRAPLCGPVP